MLGEIKIGSMLIKTSKEEIVKWINMLVKIKEASMLIKIGLQKSTKYLHLLVVNLVKFHFHRHKCKSLSLTYKSLWIFF